MRRTTARARASLLVVSFFGSACDAPRLPTALPVNSASGSSVAAATGAPAAPLAPTPAVTFRGFASPNGVVYDRINDRYLVSNVDGSPDEADGKGFISELTPGGGVTTLKWITTDERPRSGTGLDVQMEAALGPKRVTLNAPKGMAIDSSPFGEGRRILYVADLDTVRTFDVDSGKPLDEYALGEGVVADGIAVLHGKIYVSDTGTRLDKGRAMPTGGDAIWVIEHPKARLVVKSEELGNPSGLAVLRGQLFVVTLGSGELYELDAEGHKLGAEKLPGGGLVGLFMTDAVTLVSSVGGSAIYARTGNGAFVPVVERLWAAAGLALDAKRSRVVVARPTTGTVEAYDVPRIATGAD